jgi:hypothetical protein
MSRVVTETDVFRKLAKSYPPPAYCLLPQVRNGTGYKRARDSYCDALAVSLYPSRGLYFIGFEIKVSRSDWLKEVANPHKAEEFQRFCAQWYVAAPPKVVEVAEVPKSWGYIEVGARCKTVKAAPSTSDWTPPDMLLIAAILRRVHENTVQKSDVDILLAKERKVWLQSATYEHERLRKAVKAFEEASGLKIEDEWSLGDVGTAVGVLRRHGVVRVHARLSDIAATLREDAEKIQAGADALREAGDD